MELVDSGIVIETPVLRDDKEAAKSWPYLDQQFPRLAQLRLLRARGVMTRGIASGIHETLVNVVANAIEALSVQIESLREYKEFLDEGNKSGGERTKFLTETAKAVSQNNDSIYDAAIFVIDQVTKIRLRVLPKQLSR